MVELRCLADYSIIADRNETASKWLEMVGDPEGYNDGRVHGAINPIGAGTHRCSHYCVPMHSTILTRHGWKTYEQVIVGEDVMAYDMTKHVKCWTPLLAKNKFENVEIGSIGQKSLRKRLLCTKNHAWVVRTGRRRFNATEQLREAGDIGKHAAVLINAPFVNDIIKTDFKLINEKYTKDWTSEVCKLSDVELNAMLQGFLLADGYLKAGCRWSFAQAEGNLCEAFLTALYLISTNRVSACQKSRLKGPNQRWGFNVTTTQNQYMRTQDMTWRPEYVGDVWCPTTALNTWVMKQDDFITITGNSPNMANIPRVVTCSRPASSYDVVGLNKFDQLPDGDIFLGTKGDTVEVAVAGLKGGYGWDARNCWTVPYGKVQVGADASGIQLRALAHYLDDATYTETLLKGDIHTLHQRLIGLATRAISKTWIYAWLMGGGDELQGSIAGVTEAEYEALFKYAKDKKQWATTLFERFMTSLREKGRKADKKTMATIIKGHKTKEQFLDRTPALKRLKKEIIPAAVKQGYLVGLDGRKLWLPSEHLAMSIYLQGFEAVIMKQAMRLYHEDLGHSEILFKQLSFTHDEFQVETDPDCADTVGKAMVAGIVRAGEVFKTNCPLDGEYKIGNSWAECH